MTGTTTTRTTTTTRPGGALPARGRRRPARRRRGRGAPGRARGAAAPARLAAHAHEIIPCLGVLVLTSLWEGLPRVFPQAMAAGRPVVAYRVDGAPEAVAEGETGFLVEPGDWQGAADRVARLLLDPGLARRLGEAGPARVGEFDADLMVRRQEELYERLLLPGSGRGTTPS